MRSLQWRGRGGDLEGEGGAPGPAVDIQRAAHPLGQLMGDRQAEPRALRLLLVVEALDAAINAFETVADTIEGIAVKES